MVKFLHIVICFRNHSINSKKLSEWNIWLSSTINTLIYNYSMEPNAKSKQLGAKKICLFCIELYCLLIRSRQTRILKLRRSITDQLISTRMKFDGDHELYPQQKDLLTIQDPIQNSISINKLVQLNSLLRFWFCTNFRSLIPSDRIGTKNSPLF